MLVSLVIFLRPEQAGTLPPVTGPAMHAIFLKWLAGSNPTLAQLLHDLPSTKPYTVSGLNIYSNEFSLPPFFGDLRLSPEKLYWFRITALEAELARVLVTDFCQNLPTDVSILDRNFKVVEWTIDSQKFLWAGSSSYEELVSQSLLNKKQKMSDRVALLFYSPTTFKSSGRSLPLPLPVQTFNSLLVRWNSFSPIPIDETFINFVDQAVSISSYEVRSELAKMEGSNKGPKLVCFKGWCEYTCFTQASEWVQALNLIGRYAFYAGVGYKTTQGFGQVIHLDRK